MPKKAKESQAAEDWLARHEAECRSTIESWMLGSFPVPAKIITEVWPDPAWRTPLENLAVMADGGAVGFLRGVNDQGRVGIVNLDGETEWLELSSLVVPHPVLLDDLDDLREFAVEAADHTALVVPAHFGGGRAVEVGRDGSRFTVRRWADFSDELSVGPDEVTRNHVGRIRG